jgi:hypothetical protein
MCRYNHVNKNRQKEKGMKQEQEVDLSLVISFMPKDIRMELEESSRFGNNEDAKWWLSRTDEEISLIGAYILSGDYIWNVFHQEVSEAMANVRGAIERGEQL